MIERLPRTRTSTSVARATRLDLTKNQPWEGEIVDDVTDFIKEEVFAYLDTLRESGATDMFGATPYIQAEFGCSKVEARALLSEWMRTFGERHKAEAR